MGGWKIVTKESVTGLQGGVHCEEGRQATGGGVNRPRRSAQFSTVCRQARPGPRSAPSPPSSILPGNPKPPRGRERERERGREREREIALQEEMRKRERNSSCIQDVKLKTRRAAKTNKAGVERRAREHSRRREGETKRRKDNFMPSDSSLIPPPSHTGAAALLQNRHVRHEKRKAL